MLVAPAQAPLVGLTVDRDDVLPDLAEHGHGNPPASEVCLTASVRGDRADDDELVTVEVSPGLVDAVPDGVRRGHLEDGLDEGPLRPGPDDGRVRSAPRE